MSYSFKLCAASKAEAKAQVGAELDKIVASQRCHARDRAQAEAAASAFIDLLDDDITKDVVVTMSGYVAGSWDGVDELTLLNGCACSVIAGMLPRDSA